MKQTKTFQAIFIRPHSSDPDSYRREYILNILQTGLAFIAVLALLLSVVSFLNVSKPHSLAALLSNIVFGLVVLGSVLVSRRGHYRSSRAIFLGLLCVVGVQIVIQWGFMLPEALLFFAMVIVMFGVLVGARAALATGVGASLVLLLAAYLQVNGYSKADTKWLHAPFYLGDAMGYTVILVIIGLVSWLSNRETDRSLERARASEAALALERDNLEVKVAERTRELENTQLKRLLELQRFAEYGRLSANLLHEITNPLTSASLNLELTRGKKSATLSMARQSLQQLERYVEAARKQLKQESTTIDFSPASELRQLQALLVPFAKQHVVKLSLQFPPKCLLHGDPVKFAQACNNLLVNAIEAYGEPAGKSADRVVKLASSLRGQKLTIDIIDRGSGIPPAALKHLFDPFYTTKQQGRGMGIGLSLVKQVIEESFGGSIRVTSSMRHGTRFRIIVGVVGRGSTT